MKNRIAERIILFYLGLASIVFFPSLVIIVMLEEKKNFKEAVIKTCKIVAWYFRGGK